MSPTEESVLVVLSSVATLFTPFLLLGLGGLGWLIKSKVQASQLKNESKDLRIRNLEDSLREDRVKIYNSILEPFFLLFTSEEAFAQDQKFKGKNKNELAMRKMLSVEYRQIGFRLSLLANDSVVRSYNRLMQYFYNSNNDFRSTDEKVSEWMALMGELLLEIRKSMGNESSKLDRWEMIEWFMADTTTLKERYSSQAFDV